MGGRGDLQQSMIRGIDSLKGLAICLVILTHIGMGNVLSNELERAIANNGARGVQLFFLISAILTYRSISFFNEMVF